MRPRKPTFVPYRNKKCFFTQKGYTDIDYKDVELLKKYVASNGKIIPTYFTGTRSFYQRKLTTAIKRARYMALLPYTDNHRKK